MMVKVLVAERNADGRYFGFFAGFEGEEIDSYVDDRGDNKITYTLYKCTAYGDDAYRVHIANETDPQAPTYELQPFDASGAVSGVGPDYSEPFDARQLVDHYPLFAKTLEFFRTRPIDPGRRFG